MPTNLLLPGQHLPEAQPQHFYVCADCPKCGMPVFYHGGGEAVKPPTLVGPPQAVLLQTLIIPSCDCEWAADEMPANAQVPRAYNLWEERFAITTLFGLLSSLKARLEHKGQMDARDPHSSGDAVLPPTGTTEDAETTLPE